MKDMASPSVDQPGAEIAVDSVFSGETPGRSAPSDRLSLYVHEALFFTPRGEVPLQTLLSHLAREMDKRSAQGWEVLGPPQLLLSGPQVIGSEPKVTWVVWARRPAALGTSSPALSDRPGEEMNPKTSPILAVGLDREPVQV